MTPSPVRFDCVRRSLGPVELVHNNAGVIGEVAPLWEASLDAFDDVMRVHARGSFIVLRAAVQDMLAHEPAGAIVNAASNAGLGGVALRSAYVMAKHAIVGLTELPQPSAENTGSG